MSQYRIDPCLRRAAAGSELVVVDIRSGAAHVLDAAGAELLARIEDWITPADLAATYVVGLEAKSDVEPITAEVASTLEVFTAMRLVERR